MERVMVAEFNEHGLKPEEGIFYGGAELQGESQGQIEDSRKSSDWWLKKFRGRWVAPEDRWRDKHRIAGENLYIPAYHFLR